jgi:hypothetical protein
MVPVTALQAILRSQIELAINGNHRAQRDVLKAVQDLEFLKSVGAYDEPDVDGETDEAGEGGEEDESRDADETGESDEEDEPKPAARNAGNPSPSSGRVDASAASGRVGMTRHRSVGPTRRLRRHPPRRRTTRGRGAVCGSVEAYPSANGGGLSGRSGPGGAKAARQGRPQGPPLQRRGPIRCARACGTATSGFRLRSTRATVATVFVQ